MSLRKLVKSAEGIEKAVGSEGTGLEEDTLVGTGREVTVLSAWTLDAFLN